MEINISQLKRLINSLPDDGKILIEVTKECEDVYGKRKVFCCNDVLRGYRKLGKVLVLEFNAII